MSNYIIFTTEEERLQHPQARLIPPDAWNEYFDGKLSLSVISLMQAEDNDLDHHLSNLSASEKGKTPIWIALMVSHPTLTTPQVLNWLQQVRPLNKQDDLKIFLLGMALSSKNEQLSMELINSCDSAQLYNLISDCELPVKIIPLFLLHYLESKLDLIHFHNFYFRYLHDAFVSAAGDGHLPLLEYLESPEHVEGTNKKSLKEIVVNINDNSISPDYFSCLEHLKSKIRILGRKVIGLPQYFDAYKSGANNDHLPVLKYLESKLKPGQQQRMITANDCYPFRMAISKKSSSVITHLLQHPALMSYAELHQYESQYAEYVHSFINRKLNELAQVKTTFDRENPHAVFDIANPEEAKLLFYCLRNLIRRNEEVFRENILFLLELPAVRCLAHAVVNEGASNELLRLALRISNQTAAELLLTVPAVRELAQQNNYYAGEVRGNLDLRALAQDRESSMIALSAGEQQCLKQASDHYDPLLKQVGVANVMEDLHNSLSVSYAENPAQIELINADGLSGFLSLPHSWEAFQALNLSPENYQKALKAYYQHTEHTVWRYLSKPNFWMHPNASFVNVSSNNINERWSTFEEYQPLIALLYLAAQDETISAIDGYTIETRIEQFIKELALIGRAHNWDEKRVKYDKAGNLLLDDNDQVIMEEYDDLEGDRPSCYSGVKRRLFQAVLGHPLLVFLTQDKVDDELRAFMCQHFEEVIAEHADHQGLQEAWDKIMDAIPLEEKNWQCLQACDVLETKQQVLLEAMGNKYQKQFTSDASFIKRIQHAFAFKTNPDAHILNFAYVHPEYFFVKLTQQANKLKRIGFFDSSSSQGTTDKDDMRSSPSLGG